MGGAPLGPAPPPQQPWVTRDDQGRPQGIFQMVKWLVWGTGLLCEAVEGCFVGILFEKGGGRQEEEKHTADLSRMVVPS